MATPISYGRRVRSLLVALLIATGMSAVVSSNATALEFYNCGMVAPGSFCDPEISDYGRVHHAYWQSSTKSSGTLPVRINRGSVGPTAWQYILESGIAFFPSGPTGWAQVKNTTSQTHQLTIVWDPW